MLTPLPTAIKDCIRRNEHVSITLYHEGGLLPVTTRVGRPLELSEKAAQPMSAVALLQLQAVNG